MPERCFLQDGAITALSSIQIFETPKLYVLIWTKPGSPPVEVLASLMDVSWQCTLKAFAGALRHPKQKPLHVYHTDTLPCVLEQMKYQYPESDVRALLVSSVPEMYSDYSGGDLFIAHFEAKIMRPMILSTIYHELDLEHRARPYYHPFDIHCPFYETDYERIDWHSIAECWYEEVMNAPIPDVLVIVVIEK